MLCGIKMRNDDDGDHVPLDENDDGGDYAPY